MQDSSNFSHSVVSRLVRINSTETVELQNFIRSSKLLLVDSPASLGLDDGDRSWVALDDRDGNFHSVALFGANVAGTDAAIDVLLHEVLPLLRRKTVPAGEPVSHAGTENLFTVYQHPGTSRLQVVEQRFELKGALLGPVWLVLQGAPGYFPVLLLAIGFAPMLIFGVSFWTACWASAVWASSGWSHAGLQAVRLRSIGYVRVTDVRASDAGTALAKVRALTS